MVLLILALTILVSPQSGDAEPDRSSWSVDLLLSGRHGSDTEDQTPLGIEIARGKHGGTWGWLVGLSSSSDEDEGIFFQGEAYETQSLEVWAGLRRTFRMEATMQPFLATGISWLRQDLRRESFGTTTLDGSDDALGAWIELGVQWRLGAHFRLGLDYRAFIGTELEIDGEHLDSSYGQLDFLRLGVVL